MRTLKFASTIPRMEWDGVWFEATGGRYQCVITNAGAMTDLEWPSPKPPEQLRALSKCESIDELLVVACTPRRARARCTNAAVQERVAQGPDGRGRIALKRFSDGTTRGGSRSAPLLTRLCASVAPESPTQSNKAYDDVIVPSQDHAAHSPEIR